MTLAYLMLATRVRAPHSPGRSNSLTTSPGPTTCSASGAAAHDEASPMGLSWSQTSCQAPSDRPPIERNLLLGPI